jgi:hypothetical protein
MSIWGHRVSVKIIGIAVAVLALGAWVAAVNQAPDREITLVARGMAFYYLGDPVVPNPPIFVNAGERVRIVLRNDDRGITPRISSTGTKRPTWCSTSPTSRVLTNTSAGRIN